MNMPYPVGIPYENASHTGVRILPIVKNVEFERNCAKIGILKKVYIFNNLCQ